jgi:hypothetical protein
MKLNLWRGNEMGLEWLEEAWESVGLQRFGRLEASEKVWKT